MTYLFPPETTKKESLIRGKQKKSRRKNAKNSIKAKIMHNTLIREKV